MTRSALAEVIWNDKEIVQFFQDDLMLIHPLNFAGPSNLVAIK